MPETENSPKVLKAALKDVWTGRRVVGCLPLYPPVELLNSLGFTPVMLWNLEGMVGAPRSSREHLPSYACSVAHTVTEFLLSDAGASIDCILSYNACDTLRNLPEILECGLSGMGRNQPIVSFHLPMTPRAQTEVRGYLREQIESLIERLATLFNVSFSEESFASSVGLFRTARTLTEELEHAVAKERLSFDYFVTVLEENALLPIECQIERLRAGLGRRESREKERANLVDVVVSGILPPPRPVRKAMDDVGLRVVGNDIAFCSRSYGYTPARVAGVFDYYEDFYDHHRPCPTLLHLAEARLGYLKDLALSAGARGLVFWGEKFCEYEYFEIPSVLRHLEEAGIPTLKLESAPGDSGFETIRNRIEAFAEMLRSNLRVR